LKKYAQLKHAKARKLLKFPFLAQIKFIIFLKMGALCAFFLPVVFRNNSFLSDDSSNCCQLSTVRKSNKVLILAIKTEIPHCNNNNNKKNENSDQRGRSHET